MKLINLYYLPILLFSSSLFFGVSYAQQNGDKATTTPLIAEVSTEALNVRSEPDIESEVIGQLKKGDTVNVIENLDYWIHITFEDKKGWVYKPLVKLSEKENQEPTLNSNKTTSTVPNSDTAKNSNSASLTQSQSTTTRPDYKTIDGKLAVCMNEEEVRSIVGEPDNVKRIIMQANKKEIWKYHLANNGVLHVTFLNGSLIFHQVSLVN